MQLFLTSFVVQWDMLLIDNVHVLEQLRKVLRAKKWDDIYVQHAQQRYHVQIIDWDNKQVKTTIIASIPVPESLWPTVMMYVALPNKWDKAELIVQKLAELWVSDIVFWQADRSVLREANENKVARMQKIIHEAVEQSRWWVVPTLSFKQKGNWEEERNVVVFDTSDATQLDQLWQSINVGVIGPEGWLTPADYAHFPHHIVSSLGNTILRMETAAIVSAWALRGMW